MTDQILIFAALAVALRSEEKAGAKVNALVDDVFKAGFRSADFKAGGAQFAPMKAALIEGYLTAAERKTLEKGGASRADDASRKINARINRQMQAVRTKLTALEKSGADAEDAAGNAPKGKGAATAGTGKPYATRLKDRIAEARNGLKNALAADTDKRASDLANIGEDVARQVLKHLDEAIAAFAKK